MAAGLRKQFDIKAVGVTMLEAFADYAIGKYVTSQEIIYNAAVSVEHATVGTLIEHQPFDVESIILSAVTSSIGEGIAQSPSVENFEKKLDGIDQPAAIGRNTGKAQETSDSRSQTQQQTQQTQSQTQNQKEKESTHQETPDSTHSLHAVPKLTPAQEQQRQFEEIKEETGVDISKTSHIDPNKVGKDIAENGTSAQEARAAEDAKDAKATRAQRWNSKQTSSTLKSNSLFWRGVDKVNEVGDAVSGELWKGVDAVNETGDAVSGELWEGVDAINEIGDSVSADLIKLGVDTWHGNLGPDLIKIGQGIYNDAKNDVSILESPDASFEARLLAGGDLFLDVSLAIPGVDEFTGPLKAGVEGEKIGKGISVVKGVSSVGAIEKSSSVKIFEADEADEADDAVAVNAGKTTISVGGRSGAANVGRGSANLLDRVGTFGRRTKVGAEGFGRKVATGGLRNEIPLTEDEKSVALNYAIELGMPEENISFTDFSSTSYYQNWDQLRIGTDLLPSQKAGLGTLTANSRVSMKGALAHEILGHRSAALAGMTHENPLLEEVQASIRAARHAPGLTKIERTTLLRDAIARLNKSGIRIRDIKDSLWIEQKYFTPRFSK
jgi:hypothetical protein